MVREIKNFWKLHALVLLLLLLNSCSQLSSLQTAKTLEKNDAIIGAAAFGYGIQDENASGGELGSGVVPHFEIFGRYGVVNKVDLGLKLSTSGNALLDGKFQFSGNTESKFAMAAGGGFEFQGNPSSNEKFIYRVHLPIYLSFHPRQDLAIYTTPRYVFQSVIDDNNSYFIGASGGFSYRFSEDFTGMLEGSYYLPNIENSNNDGTYLYQIGLGVTYHLRN